ncbi:MAG: hypothetical protein ACREDZ_15480 [Kiloniellales bacterium]
MSTGMVENWTGNMLDIGPLYPFVGSEVLLVIVGVAVWIGWHIWQVRFESQSYEQNGRLQGESLRKAMGDD